MKLITAAEQRALDKLAAEAGLPTRALMESAGAAVAQAALEKDFARAVVFCGPGNNGGDGYVAARLLREAKLSPPGLPSEPQHEGAGDAGQPSLIEKLTREAIICVATVPREKLKGDALAAAQAWDACGGVTLAVAQLEELGGRFAWLAQGDLIVDAVFGSGLSRNPAGNEARAIDLMNAARERGARLIAVDVPSGLDADSGALFPSHLARADLTISFHLPKRGLYLHPGTLTASEIRAAPIGLPRSLESKLGAALSAEGHATNPCELLDEAWASRFLEPRPATGYKQQFGHVLVIAGSREKSGAAQLVCEAAMRAGAGLVTLCARPEVIERALPQIPELMSAPLEEREAGKDDLSLADLPAIEKALKGKTALAIGPGIARGKETARLIVKLLESLDPGCACVLDADALNALAEDRESIGAACGKPAQRPVLTPHAMEMSRLTGESVEQLESDRLGAASRAAQRFSCTLVLKGARTVIAEPGGAIGLCGPGNAGMATAGSGDVLTGITAALLARRGGPGTTFERAQLAVLLHALAGDEVAKQRGETGMVASDLFRHGLGAVFKRLGK